ncbi:hypothetical protein BH23PAT1_BH23PAT1_4150 [soil metagenome]
MNKTGIIALVVVILVVGAGVVWATNTGNNETDTNSTTVPGTTQNEQTPAPGDNEAEQSANTIIYTDSGFIPANLSLEAETELTIVNNSSRTLDFASDPHPQHTANTELNIGTIPSGESRSTNLSNTGTWGYHNHLNPGQTGSITVQ